MINAQYTVPLCNLIEAGFDIGLKDYPIWDEEHRNVLNDKIIKHYWFREIGAETPGLFVFWLNRTMNEIMPYYNDLYRTTMFEYNPIHNVDYTEEYTLEHDRDRTDTSNSTTTMSGSNTDKVTSESELDSTSSGSLTGNTSSETEALTKGRETEVDTPQGVVGLNDGDSVEYASKVTFDKNEETGSSNTDTTQTTTNTGNQTASGTTNSEGSTESSGEFEGTNTSQVNDTTSYKRHLLGNYGVKTSQTMIREERDLIINIDMMIIKDLADCFMNIY